MAPFVPTTFVSTTFVPAPGGAPPIDLDGPGFVFAIVNKSTALGTNPVQPQFFGRRLFTDDDAEVCAAAIDQALRLDLARHWPQALAARCLFLRDEAQLAGRPNLIPVYITDTFPYTIPGFSFTATHGVSGNTGGTPFFLPAVDFPFQLPGRPWAFAVTQKFFGAPLPPGLYSLPAYDPTVTPSNPFGMSRLVGIAHEVYETLLNLTNNVWLRGPHYVFPLASPFTNATGLTVLTTDGSPYVTEWWFHEIVDPVESSIYTREIVVGGLLRKVGLPSFVTPHYFDLSSELARLGLPGYDPAPAGTKFDFLGQLAHGWQPLVTAPGVGGYQSVIVHPSSVQGPAVGGNFNPAYAAAAAAFTLAGFPPAPTGGGNVRVDIDDTFVLTFNFRGDTVPPILPFGPPLAPAATLDPLRTPGAAAGPRWPGCGHGAQTEAAAQYQKEARRVVA